VYGPLFFVEVVPNSLCFFYSARKRRRRIFISWRKPFVVICSGRERSERMFSIDWDWERNAKATKENRVWELKRKAKHAWNTKQEGEKKNKRAFGKTCSSRSLLSYSVYTRVFVSNVIIKRKGIRGISKKRGSRGKVNSLSGFSLI
jgi:hypothetical protein